MSRIANVGIIGVVLGIVLGVGVSYGVGSASIPDPTGVIHGCYKSSRTAHALKVIDSAVTSGCPSGFTSLDWSQTGAGVPNGFDAFASSGTWTAPPDITRVQFEAVGGAGGACVVPGYADDAPGGDGGYVRTLLPVVPGDIYTVTVGAAGQNFSQGENATAGADSTISNPAGIVLANAGGGGPADPGQECSGPGALRGTPGSASAPNGIAVPGGAAAIVPQTGDCTPGQCGQDAYNSEVPSSQSYGGDVLLTW
jgi:hypothetical protein